MFDKENMKSIWRGEGFKYFISTSLYFEPLILINKTSWPCVFEITRVDCTVASRVRAEDFADRPFIIC